MTTKNKEEGCRVCGGPLQGNQRRWLFVGQNKKGPLTPSNSSTKSSRSRSARSSLWGSSLSLGSSVSLSNSQSLPTSSRGMDLLTVLMHVLKKSVPRDTGRGEFLCGKCASVLERIFKFDTVIARVRILSSERLQKLTQERDRVREWVCSVYRQHNPQEWNTRGSITEEENGLGSGRELGKEGDGYRDMLKDNMALSEFESWSEKWEPCPYFQRTGKRCKRGKSCEGCDALRVSDSVYESVCGVPRFLPFQLSSSSSSLALSRDKSRSMPLHWSRLSSVSSDSASLPGSSLSLHRPRRSDLSRSLDSLDGHDPFDWPGELRVDVGGVLQELKGITARPVCSPVGSRIPVRNRRTGGVWEPAHQMAGTDVVRALNFGGDDGEEFDGETKDVLTDLIDEFLPLHRKKPNGYEHSLVRQLRGQLDHALARIRTLEAELKAVTGSKTDDASPSEISDMVQPSQVDGGGVLLQTLGNALHSRERVIQDCMACVKQLCSEAGADIGEKLMEKLTDVLKLINPKASELSEQRALEREVESVREAAREREKDLDTLTSVLQHNQDVINELRVELAERERALRENQREAEAWRQRDQAMSTLLKEEEAHTQCLNEALESALQDVRALSDSVIGQGLSGGRAEATLASQLKEKEAVLSRWLKAREEHSASLGRELARLTATLKELQAGMQAQREEHSQTVSVLMVQLRKAQQELREREKEGKENLREWQNEKENRHTEERKLRDSLEKRDKLIQVLLDSEERDRMLADIQHNILARMEPRTALKHTL